MEEINQISQLLGEVQTISESYARVADATGANFNIFSILQMETDEVATHSRLIAELLNPRGSHNQKDKFLKIFKELFAEEFEFNTENATIAVEYHIGKIDKENGGRIDVLVRDNAGKVIMIENKINAGEQQNQLLRYHNAFPDGKLFFLTKDGKGSVQDLSKDLYTSISYESGIIIWLEECLKASATIPILRETISQYINLIKKITNQNSNSQMSKDIVEKIVDSERNFNAYKVLVNSQNEVFKYVIENVVFPALVDIQKCLEVDLNIDKEKFLTPTGTWQGFSFSNAKLVKLNLTISFCSNRTTGYNSFIFGFRYLSSAEKDSFVYDQIQEFFHKEFGSRTPSNNFPCWRNYNGFENWESLDVLSRMKFENFKEDILAKVELMLQIVDSVLPA